MPVNSWEELDQKYGTKPEETKAQEKKSSKVKFALILFFILIIAFVYYQFWIVPEKENSALLDWMDKMQGSSDIGLEIGKATMVGFDMNITRDFGLCENDGICNVNHTIQNLNMLSLSKSARYALESPKIIVDWHRNILNQKSGFGCDSVAKPLALTLSMTLSVSEAGLGYTELYNRNRNAMSELEEELAASNLQNNAHDVAYVTNKSSEARKSILKSYFDEINQKYSTSKDIGFNKLSSEVNYESFKSELDTYQTPGSGPVSLPPICLDSAPPQIISYQKGFIENAYGQFNSLTVAGKYEEAIPFANILYGFLSRTGQFQV